MNKITNTDQLIGKIIRRCIPEDYYVYVIAIVFNDNDWCVIYAEYATEDTSVGISPFTHGSKDDIKQYLSPFNLLEADLINRPQYEVLIEQQKTQDADKKRKYAQRLLQEADALTRKLAG